MKRRPGPKPKDDPTPAPLPFLVQDAFRIYDAYVFSLPRPTAAGEAAKLACAVRRITAGPGLAAGYVALKQSHTLAALEGPDGLAALLWAERLKVWEEELVPPAKAVRADPVRVYRVVTG